MHTKRNKSNDLRYQVGSANKRVCLKIQHSFVTVRVKHKHQINLKIRTANVTSDLTVQINYMLHDKLSVPFIRAQNEIWLQFLFAHSTQQQ